MDRNNSRQAAPSCDYFWPQNENGAPDIARVFYAGEKRPEPGGINARGARNQDLPSVVRVRLFAQLAAVFLCAVCSGACLTKCFFVPPRP